MEEAKSTTSKRKNKSTSRGKQKWFMWGGIALVILVGFVVAYQYVGPPPPEKVVILTGSKDGAYFHFGMAYQRELKERGIELEVRSTQGSQENLKGLLEKESEAKLAFVQGGVGQDRDLQALASVFLEPIWVFYRKESFPQGLTDLGQLKGKKIALGAMDSGTQRAALLLLEENRLIKSGQIQSLSQGGSESALALREGRIDAAFYVASLQASYIKKLLQSPKLELMNFRRSKAYSRRFPFLQEIEISEGMLDLARNVPRKRKTLLATTATLAARKDLHPALVPLFIQAARTIHGEKSLFATSGQFPSSHHTNYPLRQEAKYYFEHGPGFLYRVLPFWAAAFIDRIKILFLPLVTLLFPLVKIAPPVYRWRIRWKIYHWYDVLREVDEKINEREDLENLKRELQRLIEMEREVVRVDVPLSYMEEFYNLRLHIAFLRNRLGDQIAVVEERLSP